MSKCKREGDIIVLV